MPESPLGGWCFPCSPGVWRTNILFDLLHPPVPQFQLGFFPHHTRQSNSVSPCGFVMAQHRNRVWRSGGDERSDYKIWKRFRKSHPFLPQELTIRDLISKKYIFEQDLCSYVERSTYNWTQQKISWRKNTTTNIMGNVRVLQVVPS